MSGRSQVTTHYAILIGIDDYVDKPLRSCVRDVEEAKAYLESTLKDAVKIQMITTSQTTKGSTPNSANGSPLWPSYDNVISAFEEATSQAGAGSFVYIHYSGHGTRKPPSGEFSNNSTGDLALALLGDGDGQEKRVRYLWGYELARLLQAMVEKGLVVTLALDCCFSASVYRHEDDIGIRYLPYDAQVESEHPSDPIQSLANGGSTYRDASALPNWLINPDRYAILAACGPQEVATEPRFNGQRHGAMSYFLLEVIKSVGLAKRHRDIYDHVRAKFRGSGLVRQTPVLYGNQNQGFFGEADGDNIAVAIPVVVTKDGTLELQAGHAHGVQDGDQFALRPPSSAEEETRSQEPSVIFKLVHTRGLTSDLEPLQLPSIRVRTGWMAEPITRFSLRQFPIRLQLDLQHRDELVTALKARSLDVDTGTGPFAFDVTCQSSGEYKILRGSGDRFVDLPSMLEDQISVSQVADVLEHLARFRLARDLTNSLISADYFRDSYHVYIESGGKEYRQGVQIEVRHGAIAELFLENRGDKVLYAFLYNLGPSYQVENVHQGTYIVVTPRNDGERFLGTRRIKLRMRVPDRVKEQGHRSCEDIVKVFVTSRPTSFALLELPRLGGPAKARKPQRTDQVGGGPENWDALNFPIRTSLQ